MKKQTANIEQPGHVNTAQEQNTEREERVEESVESVTEAEAEKDRSLICGKCGEWIVLILPSAGLSYAGFLLQEPCSGPHLHSLVMNGVTS